MLNVTYNELANFIVDILGDDVLPEDPIFAKVVETYKSGFMIPRDPIRFPIELGNFPERNPVTTGLPRIKSPRSTLSVGRNTGAALTPILGSINYQTLPSGLKLALMREQIDFDILPKTDTVKKGDTVNELVYFNPIELPNYVKSNLKLSEFQA